jgi:ABC-2 type transport system permease protein
MLARARVVFRSRRVLYLLVSRDLKVKYADSVLGYLWSVLDPLMLAGVYWFVFTKIFAARANFSPDVPYIVFLLAALLPWNWANGVITESSRALTSEAKLVRSTNLPRETWVLRTVLSKFMEFIFSLPVLVGFMVVLRVAPSPWLPIFPLAVLLMGILLTGLGLLIAPLTVLFSDVERLVRIVLRVLFYASPVIYSVASVPEGVRDFYALNPFAGILDLFRLSLLPQQQVHLGMVASAVGISLAVFGVGLTVFHRLERPVLKEI